MPDAPLDITDAGPPILSGGFTKLAAAGATPLNIRTFDVLLDLNFLANSAIFDCAGLDQFSFKVESIEGAYPAGAALIVEDTLNGERWDTTASSVSVTNTGSTQTQLALACSGKVACRLRVTTAAAGRLRVSFTGRKTV